MNSLIARGHLRWFITGLTIMLNNLSIVRARQEMPPPPAAPPLIAVPRPSETKLSNGLRVIVAEDRDMPLVTVQVLVRNGGEADPPRLAGVAEMTGKLLCKGTPSRTATQIAEAMESLGGSLESGAAWDYSYVTATVMAPLIGTAMEVIADVLRNPAFLPEEIERLRQQSLDDLTVALREPRDIARFAAARAVFGDDGYGHPLGGTPESVKRIRRDDIEKLYRAHYRPDNSLLLIGGDTDVRQGMELAQRYFGDWRSEPPARHPASARIKAATSPSPRTIVIDMPDAGQAAVFVVRNSIRRTDPDFHTARVTNSVLGGGYSARLNQEIRIKRGLSYGAESRIDARRLAGLFSASTQTKNESAAEVVDLIRAEIERMANEPVPEPELVPRKAVLIGGFGRALETTSGLVAQFADLALNGFPLEQINDYIRSVEAVTAEDVRQFARRHLTVAATNVVVVGDAKKFLPALRKSRPDTEVIPLSQLDLNTPSLRRRPANAPK